VFGKEGVPMSKLTSGGSAGCVLALVLNVVAFAALFGLAVLPVMFENNSTLMNLQETLYCRDGETFVQDFHTQSDLRGTVRGGQIYCVDDASGQQHNVTGKAFLYAGVGFAVPFIVGLVLGMGGITALTGSGVRAVVRRASAQTAAGGAPMIVRVNQREMALDDLPPDTADLIQQALGAAQHVVANRGAANAAPLADRLRQLQDARSANLISSEEYERLRREILDNMNT
jgi:hypothetical protein